jgi:hypothetical protein
MPVSEFSPEVEELLFSLAISRHERLFFSMTAKNKTSDHAINVFSSTRRGP